jgi:RNA polymerase sigma-70 factor (ECF subfamily)
MSAWRSRDFFLIGSVDLSEKTVRYGDVPMVSLSFLPSDPSSMKHGFDERRASRAAVARDLARIGAALRRNRIPSWDRRDLAQDIVLAALESWRKRGAEVAAPERWFNGIILNHVRRWRKRRFVEMTRSEEGVADETEVIDKTGNAEEFLMSEERRRLLYQLYDQLPADHLDAVIAREHDELTFEEIAAAFEKPVSTVYRYYQAGMRELREAFERWKAKQRDGGAMLLPLTLEALFDADRTAPPEPPSAADVERAWRRYQEVRGNAGPEGSAPTSASRPRYSPHFTGMKAALPVLIASTLASQPSVEAAPSAAAPLDSTAALVAPADLAATTAPVAIASSAPGSGAPDTIAPASASAAPAAPRPQTASGSHSTGRADSAALIAEQRMLEQARSASLQKNMQAALTALEEYAQTYPDGQYAREMDRMWIEALVALGRTSEACRRAESLRRAYLDAEYLERLGELCLITQ